MNSDCSENYFDPIESLTPRELSILRLMNESISNKEISVQLHLSINTVKWYARQIFGKLGVQNRRQAINQARNLGLLKKISPSEFFHHPISLAKGNLPSPLNQFIGRKEELTYLTSTLTQPLTHLITLLGPGGIGKTRLAIETAYHLKGHFTDGIWLFDTARELDPDLIPQRIAATLGITYYKRANHQTALINSLREKQILLILDNIEHLVDSMGWYIENMLRKCPGLVVLATSRRPLKIYGEIRYHVQPLYTPDPENTIIDEDLSKVDAVQLFIDRATSFNPNFSLTDKNIPVVAQICHKLDGIPLAIELAAGRTNALTIEDVAVRLDEWFSLLTGGPQSALPRYQTLHASIDWSYHFLSPQEKNLFHRLAIFKSSWSLKAAEAICSGDGIKSYQIIDSLASLVDQSLIVVDPRDPHHCRYSMLETIHKFALNKLLDTGDQNNYLLLHLSYFHDLCEELIPGFRSGEKHNLFKQLSLDKDNLIGAINWALETEDGNIDFYRIQQGVDLAAGLQDFWNIHNLYPQAEKWLKKGLALLSTSQETIKTRGKALLTLYKMVTSWIGGDHQEYLDESISLLRQTNDFSDLAEALGYNANNILMHKRDLRLARQRAEESLVYAKRSEDDWIVASMLHLMAGVCVAEGNINTARAFAQESERLALSTGDLGQIWIYRFGESLLTFPNPEHTKTALFKALRICRENQDIENEILVLFNIADITYVEKDFVSMQSQFQYCLDRSRDFGMLVRVSWGLRHTATAWKYLGNIKKAAALFFESLQLSLVEGFNIEITYAIAQLAGLASLIDKTEKCVQLLGFASTLPGYMIYPSFGIDGLEFKIDTEFAHLFLDEKDFSRLFESGKGFSYETALSEVNSIIQLIQASPETTDGYQKFVKWYMHRGDDYSTLTPIVLEDNTL